jgi:uncharacterized membrane protein
MPAENIQRLLQNFRYKQLSTRILSYLALFIAFTAVATYLHIPGPTSSYFNLGEVAIYIIALVFGGRSAAVAGAVGSSLVDLLLGYSIWAPFTFVIKGLEGFVVGRLAHNNDWRQNITAIIVGGNLMVVGYAVTKGFLISWPAVLPEVGIDYAQMIIGGIVALPIARQLNHYLGK